MDLNKVKRGFRFAGVVWIVVVTVALFRLLSVIKKKDREIGRLKGNQTELMGENMRYRTRHGLAAARVRQLELSVDEYKAALDRAEGVRAGQKAMIEELDLKVRRLVSVQQTILRTAVDTTVRFAPLPRDDGLYGRGRGSIEWQDRWVTLRVAVDSGRASVSVSSVDTLYQVVHKVPKRFLGIPYGVKGIRQEIVSSNPHSVIVYSEYIELKNKKKL